MARMTRRRFLQTVALSSGALAVQMALGRADILAGQTNQASRDGTIFLQGDIITVDRVQGTLVINERGEAPVTLRVSGSTRIWKGEVTDLAALEPGDFLYLRALPEPDGTFTATKIWANIANLRGTVAVVEAEGFQLQMNGPIPEWCPEYLAVRFRPGMVVNDGSRLVPKLRPGQPVQVLGLVERDGAISATRMWVAE